MREEARSAQLEVDLLGRFEVRVSGRTAISGDWPRRKALALLKLLALQPSRSMHREQTYDVLWPDLDPPAAANNLRQNLHHLRRALGDRDGSHVISITKDTISLSPAAALDIDAFQRAAHSALRQAGTSSYEVALAKYRGDLLPDDFFEDWTEPHRSQLRTLRNRLLLRAGRAYAEQGQHESSIARLEELLQAEPLQESAVRLLMRSYAKTGSRDRARRAYTAFSKTLRREVGASPATETRDLYEELGRGTVPDSTPNPVDTAESSAHQMLRAPELHYATAIDGTRIAFWTLGSGKPLVKMPDLPISNLGLEWQAPEVRSWYERLAADRMLIQYDCRGSGLSDRAIEDCSPEAHLLDLEAVVDRLSLQTFALYASGHGGPVSIMYAAQHPERVSHLILWASYARIAQYADSPAWATVRAFGEGGDWQTYTQILAHVNTGWSHGDLARRVAEYMQESISPDVLWAFREAFNEVDVASLLPEVRVPVLVLQPKQLRQVDIENVKSLAAQLSNGRLTLIEGDSEEPFLCDAETVLSAIDALLDNR